MVKVELHTHTADDPVDRIPHTTTDLIDRAAALGYGALAVTLHERQLDLGPHRGYAFERGIALISGIEQTVEGRHVLLLNFSGAAGQVRTFDDLARLRVRESQGLVVAPHPFFPGGSCLRGDLERRPELFDAVEHNAMVVRGIDFNARAAEWAARHDKPLVGNGDVHRLAQLGSTYSLVDAPADADAVCAAVRAGRVVVESRPLPYATAARVLGAMVMGDLWRVARETFGAPEPAPSGAL